MNSSHRELQPGPAATGLRLSLGLTWKKDTREECRRRRRRRRPAPRFPFSQLLFFSSLFISFLLTTFAASRHVLPLNQVRLLIPCTREERGGSATAR